MEKENRSKIPRTGFVIKKQTLKKIKTQLKSSNRSITDYVKQCLFELQLKPKVEYSLLNNSEVVFYTKHKSADDAHVLVKCQLNEYMTSFIEDFARMNRMDKSKVIRLSIVRSLNEIEKIQESIKQKK